MGDCIIVCDQCAQIFPSRNKLFKHVRYEHQLENHVNNVETLPKLTPIRIIHEDKFCMVILKPQGMATMGIAPRHTGTRVGNSATSISTRQEETVLNSDALIIADNIKYKKALPVHRLDRCTGGLMLCSKSLEAEVLLKQLFRENQTIDDKLVKKRYRCIVPGIIPPEYRESIALDLDHKPSITMISIVNTTRSAIYGSGWLSTIDCYPITVRMHQIRRHLSLIGHPIIGYQKYSTASTWPDNMAVSVEDMNMSTDVLTCKHCYLQPPFFLWSLELSFPLLHFVNDQLGYSQDYQTITIPEPYYYEVFRQYHQSDYLSKNTCI